MFARNAHFRVKSLDLAPEFALTLQNEVLPLLRRQTGFQGEITMSNPGSLERISISLWDNREHAEAYNVKVYPEVLKILARLIDGGPSIQTFDTLALNLNGDAANNRQGT